ncbi:MAG: inovirus-type Gp2 protein [Polaromonas sp.]
MLGYQTYGDKSLFIIEEDMKALSRLEMIETTALAISKRDDEIFSVRTEKRTGLRIIENGALGKALYLSLKIPIDEIVMYFPLHSFSPYFNAFREAVKRHELDQIPGYPLNIFRNEEAEDLAARMNAFVETLRMETRTPEFKAAIRKTQRSCNKNFKGFMTYMHELFQKNGRLLGLRVDFGYKKISNFDQAGSDVSYEEAKRHREALIDEIRKRFKDVLAGYVWKFEYGLLKGYHIHVLIFLDGSKVREDVTIAKMLGEHWNSTLTGGVGAYYNCNAKKSSYRFCGIGMLRHDDPQIWEGLEKIATYLTKPDYYVKLNMPGNDHALGKGGPPKQYAKKRGRPRKSDETPD